MLVVVVLAGVAGTLRYAQRAAFERDEARKARDESVAIVDFVEEVFSGRGDGRVDVREALAAGARAADRRFERHPYAEAGVRSLLGKIYIVLDDYGRAEAQLERALQIRRASGNGTSLALHDTMLALASLYRHEGKFEASEAMLREVIGQRERMAGKNDWSTVSALVNLGQFEHSRGDSAAAVAVYRDCLQRVAADDGDERVWGIRGRLGSALADVGAFVEAHKLLEGTLEFQRKHFGEVHQETLATMRGLVELMLVEGDFAGAELMFADLIPLSEQVFGKESPTVAACLMAQAQMYQRQGHGTLALDLLRRIVSIHEAAYAPAHVDRLSGEVALGVALGQARLFDEAEALLQRGYQTALGAEHKESRLFARDFATALSMLCVRQGRVEDGEKWEAISKRLERPDGTSERK